MRKVAIDAEFKRVERYKRRVGRTRFYWLQNTMARAHKLWRKSVSLSKVRFNINNATLRREIAETANNRAHLFDKQYKVKRKKVKTMRSRKNTRRENGVKRNIGFAKKMNKCYRSKHKAWKQGPPQNNGPPEGNTNTSNSSSHQGNSQQAPPRGTNSHQGNS